MRKLMMMMLAASILFTTGCGSDKVEPKDDDDPIENCTYLSYVGVFTNEFSTWQNAITAYFNNQSDENCDKVKDATKAYLEALRKWEDCAKELNFLDELQESIDDALADVDDLDCD